MNDAHTPALRHNAPATDRLHPLIYKGLGLLALWLVISVIVLFNRGQYMSLTTAAIAGIFVMIVGIPFQIWRIWCRSTPDEVRRNESRSFFDWRHRQFETSSGSLSGTEAAILILLPIIAVSFGMTAFGLVLYFTLPTLGYS
jgi:hypothetical protein